MNDALTGRAAERRRFLAGAALALAGGAARAGAPAPAGMAAQRLGWAGIRLQVGETTLWIDPLANAAVWGAALRDTLSPIEPASDDRYVLVTHRHPDHDDPDAVARALGAGGTLLSASPTGPLPVPAGSRSRAVELYEPQLLGDMTAIAVPAADGYGDPQVSWIVSGGGRRVIHCGDTLWHGHWWKIARLGPFDAAFLPINGARFGWRKPASGLPGVMTPEQAAAAAEVIGARLIVPIHYGMRPSAEYTEAAHPAHALVAAADARHVDVEFVRAGAWLTWQARGCDQSAAMCD
jgi:L-ascorbate metabolism protein UlaG (beta-lactamase superfamily)